MLWYFFTGEIYLVLVEIRPTNKPKGRFLSHKLWLKRYFLETYNDLKASACAIPEKLFAPRLTIKKLTTKLTKQPYWSTAFHRVELCETIYSWCGAHGRIGKTVVLMGIYVILWPSPHMPLCNITFWPSNSWTSIAAYTRLSSWFLGSLDQWKQLFHSSLSEATCILLLAISETPAF